MNLGKKCVFCGNLPTDKNKEHVLPKWLLSLTGNENRSVSISYDWQGGKPISFSLSSFTLPSCEVCNSTFAHIEGEAKCILEKILADDYVNADDLLVLLDWFDKIRIGLWLAANYLNKGFFQIDPKFHINQRVGVKDRFLSITNLYNNHKGLSWFGLNTMCFIYNPTCLGFQINHMLFINSSYEFLVSKHLGFPFAKQKFAVPNETKIDIHLKTGTNKISGKLFDTKISEPHFKILQPIFGQALPHLVHYYDNDYIRSNSLDFNRGIGKIFIKSGTETFSLDEDEEICFKMYDQIKSGQKVPIIEPTLELQIELMKKAKMDVSLLTPDEQENYHSVRHLLINNSEKYLRAYKQEVRQALPLTANKRQPDGGSLS